MGGYTSVHALGVLLPFFYYGSMGSMGQVHVH